MVFWRVVEAKEYFFCVCLCVCLGSGGDDGDAERKGGRMRPSARLPCMFVLCGVASFVVVGDFRRECCVLEHDWRGGSKWCDSRSW